ncbi:galactose oxidase [Gymnopus androsaceus JB14]|uniref:Galactose oxidase n=1 Tax=Gymnopus androsaceus JB14 TaxID=1447944 RepID=A0A6A4HMU3_9AGAR|nr:galactose oxidase [Gymnopus androsaceus JB14]
MAKKKASSSNKATAKAAKKAKATQKTERKETKKNKSKDADNEDLESILEQMRKEHEALHLVTEEVADGVPSRRANATLTACPSGNFIWFIGGEFFSEDGKAVCFRYSPEKDEWRKFVSPTCPGPRSAHAVVATASGGGKLFLFGGEFSSQNQTTFYHYRDFWVFDIGTHSWDRIETKIKPTARSGHRMAVWKHYIVLFGGFFDPGITTRYLNDLWVFNTQEYTWRLIEFKPNEIRPSPRSGFSFLSTPDGIILHGGYCKEYAKGKHTWFLKMTLPDANAVVEGSSSSSSSKSKTVDPLTVKWERRKRPSTAYAPALRSGCTMTAWASKETGIMFGGVTDEDTDEETLESVFWNDLNGYQWPGKGRWVSMALRKPKKKAGGGAKKNIVKTDEDDDDTSFKATPRAPSTVTTKRIIGDDIDPEDPTLTTPLPRYNAMLAVLRNTLYIYGGIFERGSREYTLDDFYYIHLDKMERYVCLKESGIVITEGDDESDEEDDEDDSDFDDEDEDGDGESDTETVVGSVDEDEPSVAEVMIPKSVNLRSQATAFMGVAKDASRSPEDILSTPLPGETLAMFYSRSREYWSQKALSAGVTEARGKQLRRDGFSIAQERYTEYKPILEEVERMLSEAGLDEEEIRRSATSGPDVGGSRNRR